MAAKTKTTELVETTEEFGSFDPTPVEDDPTPVEDEVTEPDSVDEGEEFPLDQYSIRVNGKIVWTSGSDARLVNMVKVNNARGEVTAIGSHVTDKFLDITVNIRDYYGSDLDLVEYRKEQERVESLERAYSPEAIQEKKEAPSIKEVEPIMDSPVSNSEPFPKPTEKVDLEVESFEPFEDTPAVDTTSVETAYDNDKVSEPVSRTEF